MKDLGHPLALTLTLGASMTLAASLGPLAAQPSRKQQSHRMSPSRIAPDTTASIPAKSAGKSTSKPAVATPDDETLPTPFNLPTASRSRVRECGDKWQSIKLSGQAGERIWREFATGCLAAKAGPFEMRDP